MPLSMRKRAPGCPQLEPAASFSPRRIGLAVTPSPSRGEGSAATVLYLVPNLEKTFVVARIMSPPSSRLIPPGRLPGPEQPLLLCQGCRLRQLYRGCRDAGHADFEAQSSDRCTGERTRREPAQSHDAQILTPRSGQDTPPPLCRADCRSRGRKGCDQPKAVFAARAGSG